MKWRDSEIKHNVKLEINEHHAFVIPYIDGEYLPFCLNIDPCRNPETGEETVKFETTENLLRILMSDCECDLSDYIKIAIIILRDELLKHGDLYKAFSVSIYSALKDMPGETWIDEIPEIILKRIIGED